MSDQSYETFQHYGTNAERLAFTPNPAATIQPLYEWYETDTGKTFLYDTSWHQISGPGSAIPAVVQGDTLYASGANTIAALTKDTNATRYLSNTGSSNNPAWAQVNLANGVTGDLPFANLTQGSALSVLGVTGNATADNASIAAGSDHQVLRRSGTAVAFGQVNVGQSAAITGVLPVANGGTGLSVAAYPLRYARIVIDNSQIKKLTNTAIELVAAPGANLRIKPIGLTYAISAVVATYTGLSATYAALQCSWDTSSGAWAANPVLNDNATVSMTDLTRFMAGAAHDAIVDVQVPFLMTGPAVFGEPTRQFPDNAYIAQVNKAIVISIDNNGSGTDLGGGDASQSLTVTLGYYLESYA